MRYAVHQVLIELSAEAFVSSRGRGAVRLAVGMEYADFAVDDLVDELLGLVDAVGDLGGKDGLTVKARGLYVLVSGDDDAVAVRDLLSGQDVLRTAGAVCFDLDRNTHAFACLGKSLSRHVGMGDTCRARGDCKYPVACLCFRCGRLCLVGELLGFLIVDDFQEFLGRFRRLQLRGEVLVHEHLHQSCEYLEVNVTVGGCRNHEDQLAGLSVGSLIVHTVRDGDGGESGSLDSFALGVGDSDLHADSGRSHAFTGKDTFLVSRNVVEVAAFCVQINQQVDRFALTLRGSA